MDKEVFIEKVKELCAQKGVRPTVACRESGVGTSFLTDIKRGRNPSAVKFQKLAAYLGTTVSALIGEEKPAAEDGSGSLSEFARLYAGLSAENRNKIIAEMLRLQRGQ